MFKANRDHGLRPRRNVMVQGLGLRSWVKVTVYDSHPDSDSDSDFRLKVMG